MYPHIVRAKTYGIDRLPEMPPARSSACEGMPPLAWRLPCPLYGTKISLEYRRNARIDPSIGVRTRRAIREEVSHSAFISMVEPTRLEDALDDEAWVEAMQEELNQFVRNDVWELVPRPKNHSIIGTKWVFKNKSNDDLPISTYYAISEGEDVIIEDTTNEKLIIDLGGTPNEFKADNQTTIDELRKINLSTEDDRSSAIRFLCFSISSAYVMSLGLR